MLLCCAAILAAAASVSAPNASSITAAPTLRRTLAAAPYAPKAVALDVDGTLLTASGSVGDRTAKALNAFVSSGGLAVIATGRRAHQEKLQTARLTC